jgi:uncharacterized protein
MRIAVLGATGRTGMQLVVQALARGHSVVALCREPARLPLPPSPALTVARVDVQRAAELGAALAGVDALVSGLGNVRGQPAGVLAAGAHAVRQAGVGRVVWLGGLGTGVTRDAGGPILATLLPVLLGADVADKSAAEELVRAAGASVVHAGPLGDGRARGGGRLLPPGELPRRWWPSGIARADLAALMLDEAEGPQFGGATAVAWIPKQRRTP